LTAWRQVESLLRGSSASERFGGLVIWEIATKKTEAFEHWLDLKVVEQVPIVAPAAPLREKYMDAKRDKMGHILPSMPLQT
jgi:hypothetical protein